jgi:sulfopropanediol 3-dehydrogenase
MATYLKKAAKTPTSDERETREIVERILKEIEGNGEEAYIRHYGAKFKDWSGNP